MIILESSGIKLKEMIFILKQHETTSIKNKQFLKLHLGGTTSP